MTYAIRTQMLSKSFAGVKAVNNIDLEVQAGSIYGYIGANGSGKTTTIRMLLGLIKAGSGTIQILDKEIPQSFHLVAPYLGVVPGEIRLYEELTGRETLDYFQGFLKSKATLREKLLADFKLNGKDLNKKVRYFSQGMKQKLLLIQAMQHNPDLLILDEPSERLDPLIQQTLYSYIADFQSRGKTIFFSSHNLAEVEKVCDYIGILKDGRLLVQDKISVLKKRLPRMVKIKFSENINPKDFESDKIMIEGFNNGTLILKVDGPMGTLLNLLKKYNVTDLDIPESSLESFFMGYYRAGENNAQ